MRKSPVFALLCLMFAGYSFCQANPQNPPAGGQQTSTASADQPAKSADDAKPATDVAKPAANDAKPAANDTTTKTAPANTSVKIPSGSRIYVAPMNGYENYVVAGILKKKVPVQIVADREKAEYEIRGATDSERAGWAKMLFLKSDYTNEQASIVITEIKSGDVVFAYSVNFHNSGKGKQSTAESIGKHLKKAVGKD